MRTFLLTLALLFGSQLSLASTNSTAADEVTIKWKNKAYSLSELPPEAGKTVAATASIWAEWVLENDYRMDLSTDGRVLVISRRKNSAISRQLKLIDKTTKYFDKLLPAPKRLPPEKPDEKPEEEAAPPGSVPEDPEDGPAGWDDAETDKGKRTNWSYEWGATTFDLDTETCVFFIANKMEHYNSILEKLGESQDYLKSQLGMFKKLTGFVLERPLAAAYIENVSGQEEWDPNNELVNRVSQMLLVRRFAQMPYWFQQGFAWHVEYELLGGLYCFPYRSEFVFATEHTAWPSELKKRYKKKKKPRAVEMHEFADWRRGKFEQEPGQVSYGLVTFLAKHHKAELANFAERLRVFWDKDNRVDNGPGSWSRKPGYEISSEDQRKFLAEFFGDDVLEEAAKSFVAGKGYRPKKK